MRIPAASGGNDRNARIERLRISRAKDSEDKTRRALDAVDGLLRSGRRITVTQVAREASVSTWFVYNQPQVHQAVQDGITAQRAQGRQNSLAPEASHVSPAGLRTDLALAREEIKDLKKERDRLRNRVRLSLGAELEVVNQHGLIERVQQVEQRNTALEQALSEARDQIAALEGQLREAEDDLTAARASLRRAMRAVPSS
jgi:chromosome segregation ATPase